MQLACVLATALTLFSPALPPSWQQSTSQESPPAPAPPSSPAENTTAPQAATPASDPAKAGPAKATPRKRRARKAKTAAPLPGEPRKIVVHQGGVTEPVAQIMPGMTAEEANRQRQDTERLLAAADFDLKQLSTRNLNSNQQGTVGQIGHYMDVARNALGDGDIQRAHTLALKARLLSDDLVKQ